MRDRAAREALAQPIPPPPQDGALYVMAPTPEREIVIGTAPNPMTTDGRLAVAERRIAEDQRLQGANIREAVDFAGWGIPTQLPELTAREETVRLAREHPAMRPGGTTVPIIQERHRIMGERTRIGLTPFQQQFHGGPGMPDTHHLMDRDPARFGRNAQGRADPVRMQEFMDYNTAEAKAYRRLSPARPSSDPGTSEF